MKKSVIVTGGSGFLGKRIVMALTEAGYSVVALSINFDDELKNNSDVICIDVAGKAVSELSDIIPNNEYCCMYHFAWNGTSGPKRADYNIQLENAKMTCDYVTLCKKIGCKRFIYASTINVMETYEYFQKEDISPSGGYIYGTGKMAAHLMGESVAKLNDIDFIPVIITNVYGVGEKSARMIYTSINKLVHGEHCSFTEGYQMYDFIYLTDAINAIIAVSEKGKPFNQYYIGSGKPRPLREFLLEMRDIVDPDAEIGLGDLQFNGADISYEQFDLNKVQKDTGYTNKISFSEGIKLTAEYIRSEM